MYRSVINLKNPGYAGYKKMVGRYCGRAKERYWELDFVRGLCVTLMVFDHFMFCMWGVLPFINEVLGTSFLAGAEKLGTAYWVWPFRQNFRFWVVTAFFILCGISCTLTRGNFRRSIPLALVAAGITAFTVFLENFGLNEVILFGVIHMLAAAVFLYAVLDNAAVAVGDLLGDGKINSSTAKKIIAALLESDFDPEDYVMAHGLEQINDRAVLEEFVREVLASDSKSVSSYKAGKTAALKAVVGKVMAKTAGKANPITVNELVETLISEY